MKEIGDVLLARGDPVGALATYRESADVIRELSAKDPSNTAWQRLLSSDLSGIGGALQAQGDISGALAAASRLRGPSPDSVRTLPEVQSRSPYRGRNGRRAMGGATFVGGKALGQGTLFAFAALDPDHGGGAGVALGLC